MITSQTQRIARRAVTAAVALLCSCFAPLVLAGTMPVDTSGSVFNSPGQVGSQLTVEMVAERYIAPLELVLKPSPKAASETVPGPVAGMSYGQLPEAKRAQVPLPGAIWLFGSGLFGFVFLSNRKRV